MSRGSLALALGLALGGCVSAIPHATEQDARRAAARFAGVTAAELEIDRGTYVKRCAGCHSLYLPSRKSPAAWPATVAEMGERGNVAPEDLARIERYLVTMSDRPER